MYGHWSGWSREGAALKWWCDVKYMRFYVLTATKIPVLLLWVMTSYSLIGRYVAFRRNTLPSFSGLNMEPWRCRQYARPLLPMYETAQYHYPEEQHRHWYKIVSVRRNNEGWKKRVLMKGGNREDHKPSLIPHHTVLLFTVDWFFTTVPLNSVAYTLLSGFEWRKAERNEEYK